MRIRAESYESHENAAWAHVTRWVWTAYIASFCVGRKEPRFQPQILFLITLMIRLTTYQKWTTNVFTCIRCMYVGYVVVMGTSAAISWIRRSYRCHMMGPMSTEMALNTVWDCNDFHWFFCLCSPGRWVGEPLEIATRTYRLVEEEHSLRHFQKEQTCCLGISLSTI